MMALEQPIQSLARDVGAAAPHRELALDRGARPPRPFCGERSNTNRGNKNRGAEVAWELLGRALAAPDVRGPTDPGHERDLHASQSSVELEGRARRAVGAAGDFESGGHCVFWFAPMALGLVLYMLLLLRVDGVGAGAIMLLVQPFQFERSLRSNVFQSATQAMNGCPKCLSNNRNGDKRQHTAELRRVMRKLASGTRALGSKSTEAAQNGSARQPEAVSLRHNSYERSS